MAAISKIRRWSHHRQRLGKQGSDPIRVLEDIMGVYSSHPSGPLSLHARIKRFDAGTFNALDSNHLALRVPAMRLSIYMLPGKIAHTVFSATVPPPDDPAWQRRYGEISEEEYRSWKDAILDFAVEPRSGREIKDNTGIPDISVKSTPIIKLILNRMCYEGELLRVNDANIRASTLRYVGARTWAGERFKRGDRKQALAWLAGEYLRAFGPARTADFKWWAGVSAGDAETAVASVNTKNLGDDLLIPVDDIKGFDTIKDIKGDTVDILPPWDSYTMGYAPDGRDRLVSRDVQEHLYGKVGATGGNAVGAVMINGLAHGTWSGRFVKQSLRVDLGMFEKPSAKLRSAIDAGFDDIASFLGAESIEIAER